jgi:Fe(3+) dicitrate transport protein
VKLVLGGTTDSRLILTIEGYREQHGEPGGLTFATGTGAVNYNEDRNATSRFYDMFALDRYFGSLAWERDFSAETKLSVTAWGTIYQRFSSRQRGGGFGTLPVSTPENGFAADKSTIENQEFYTEGIEARLRHDYQLWGGTHTIAAGMQAYHTASPRQDMRGDAANAQTGEVRNDSDREVFYLPVFVENRFQWGALSITPGVRFENIWQSVKENVNLDKTAARTPLADESTHDFVPLFGLGAVYELAKSIEVYGNVSQSYRPKVFTQSVPTGGTTSVPEDLTESSAIQYDIGFRGNPTWWANWDVSAFLLDFDDQIGTIALPGGFSTLANVGHAEHYGIEAAGEIDLIGLGDAISVRELDSGKDAKAAGTGRDLYNKFGSVSLYGNVTLLDAEFVSGPLEGKTPRFAPDYLVRGGLIYRYHDRLKLAFLGTFVGDSYADDANTAERFVPAHMVWDLTVETKVYKDIVTVNAGINNLFDEDYYSRITNSGIDPAARRNFYGGVALKF